MDSSDIAGFTISSGRGTLDVIWSCLATILLCTWTVQRLQFVAWTSERRTVIHRKTFWFTNTLLCPEYTVWVLFEQWQRARKYREVRKLGCNNWTMQHGFYIDMGCFQAELKGKSASLPTASRIVTSLNSRMGSAFVYGWKI
jgi:hypothetical protein